MPRQRSPVTVAEEKVDCAFCGAAAGKRCLRKNGKPYAYSHALRHYKAMRAGHLPLKDANG